MNILQFCNCFTWIINTRNYNLTNKKRVSWCLITSHPNFLEIEALQDSFDCEYWEISKKSRLFQLWSQWCRSKSGKLRRRSWSCQLPIGTSPCGSSCKPEELCNKIFEEKKLFRSRDLFDGDLVGLAPLHANSRIKVVQLAGSQGNGLGRISH